MKLNVAFAALLALSLPLLSPHSARAEEKSFEIATARIKLPGANGSDGINRGKAGLIYGGDYTMAAELAFYDAAGRELGGTCPVVVRTRSIGATAFFGGESNEFITLGNVDGKKPSQLIGSYYGLQVGAAFTILGANGTLAANKNAVIMNDVSYLMGLGIDVSVPKISVLPDNARMANFTECKWNRALRVSKDYTGAAEQVSDGALSKNIPNPPSGKPGEDHKHDDGGKPVNVAI